MVLFTNGNFFKWASGTLSLPYEFYLGSGQEPKFLMESFHWKHGILDVLGVQQISDITRRRASENQTHVLYDSAAG